jgi:two-component system response regulator AtoC
MQGLLDYEWPGNVRELENMIKRIVVLQSEDMIAQEIFASPRSAPPATRDVDAIVADLEEGDGTLSLRDIGRRAARDAEREALKRVLYQTNWNRKKAAKILEVSYKTLLQKIKDCGLADS